MANTPLIPDRRAAAPHGASWRRKRAAAQRRPRILTAELFQSLLLNERKRADRSGQPSVVLRLAVQHAGASSPSTWAPAIEAIGAVTRDTDVLGWLEWRKKIGIILTDIRAFDADAARSFETRIRAALDARLNTREASRFMTSLSVHPDETG